MVNSISDAFRELDFYELHQVFLDSNYYQVLFPFLLAYVLFYTVLGKIGIFQYKNGNRKGEPIKSVIVIVSLIVSFFGVSFEVSPGESVGSLMMVMFPNISALTIGVLMLYIVGSMFGLDFFKGMFRRDHSAYLYLAVGVIGLGSVIYYVGISMGLWDFDPLDAQSHWNVVIAVAMLILGVVFLFIDMVAIGVVLLMVFGAFVYNYGDGNILEYFVDPIVFIILIIVVTFSWVNSDKDRKDELEYKIRNQEKTRGRFKGAKDYDTPIRDIVEEAYLANKKELDRINRHR